MGRGGYRGKAIGVGRIRNEQELNRFLANSNSPLVAEIRANNLVEEDWLNGGLVVNTGAVQYAAKSFVRGNRDIKYSREYLLSLVKADALTTSGQILTDREAVRAYNAAFKVQAKAILTTARAGNVRLTSAQVRYLTNATRGNYIRLQFTTESSAAGSLANAINTGRGTRGMVGTAAAKKAARLNFLEITGRLR